jgi:hypothetical protein
MIKLTRVKREAWPDSSRDWSRKDGRDILRPMETETVFVAPRDVIAVQPTRIRTGWDPDRIERPCRNVGKEQPWWIDEGGAIVHVRQVGKWTVTETPGEVRFDVERALS